MNYRNRLYASGLMAAAALGSGCTQKQGDAGEKRDYRVYFPHADQREGVILEDLNHDGSVDLIVPWDTGSRYTGVKFAPGFQKEGVQWGDKPTTMTLEERTAATNMKHAIEGWQKVVDESKAK